MTNEVQNSSFAAAMAAMGNTSLIMGELAAGKSTHTVRRVLQYGTEAKVLWIAFDNVGALEQELWGHETPNWEFHLLGSWKAFNDVALLPIRSHKDERLYDVIVVEGLHILANVTLNSVANGNTVTQADWGVMGKMIQTAMIDLRDHSQALYVTCAIVDNDENGKELGINRDLYNRVMPLMGKKMYASTRPVKNATTGTLGVGYTIQENPTLAIKLKPAEK